MGSYFRLLRSPDAATLAVWGMVGRLPIAMRSIGCLMFVSAVTGSLAEAGAVAAAMLLAQGVVSPVLGRTADRVGQRRVLLTAAAAHMAGIAALTVSIVCGAPLVLMILAAVATGCTSVSFTSFMRAVLGPLLFAGRPAGVFTRFTGDLTTGIVSVLGANSSVNCAVAVRGGVNADGRNPRKG
ncbi:hypothetical protein ACF1FX_27855 [Streptomyces sp. NPDC014646]|uniref:hypothetical protein n=1 Tax=Streptomyces sp. NPDC014646 TaxID=3364877 RepID=UPI0036FB2536